MKYAQKRLGKIHYTLSKDDVHYANDLINCQIKLHAEVLSDYLTMVSRVLHIDNLDDYPRITQLFALVHDSYVQSAPTNDWQSALTPEHLILKEETLAQLTKKTGKKLFKLLPVTGDLLAGNVQIFQGQVRLEYINFLDELGRRIKTEEVLQDLAVQEPFELDEVSA